ncbi:MULTISPECIES: dTDP-4-dehydrorhamnose 3,5-epimerase [unclassified Legionella]|uniref:dTDP-4-dehydrorhamnose 3,5-epimerase n=1 Tax=unclassified Legionella TaxID=2622702 RepID=UPI001054CDDA|nr:MULTISPECIES: dTDP-4-dehydrorhamnose 3,5-epimerase [unclassified Legionella]MDI9817751.1 dTDP-4-dehydrorhamnose 3,5-epimerase [Legionella sp. PL877]
MKIINTSIPEVKIIEPRVFGDERGFFFESFQMNRYQEQAGISDLFVQDNISRSRKGVLRGLHYQVQHPQGKLVTVLAGCVFDVAVDIRRDSPTFAQWVGVELSADNHRQLWIPKGFAHGFYVLSTTADFIYKCTDYYYPESEVSIRYDDPDLAIDWPLKEPPCLSDKDFNGMRLSGMCVDFLPIYSKI